MTPLPPIVPALSRRRFLMAATIGLASGCTRRPYRAGDFSVPVSSPVAILPASTYDVDFADLIGRGANDAEAAGVAADLHRALE